MPRANNPIDKVLDYFKHADINAAEVALHMAKGILRDRVAAGTTEATLVRKAAPKKKAKAKVPTPPKPSLTPVQAGAEGGN
jgi:hypothetical protein